MCRTRERCLDRCKNTAVVEDKVTWQSVPIPSWALHGPNLGSIYEISDQIYIKIDIYIYSYIFFLDHYFKYMSRKIDIIWTISRSTWWNKSSKPCKNIVENSKMLNDPKYMFRISQNPKTGFFPPKKRCIFPAQSENDLCPCLVGDQQLRLPLRLSSKDLLLSTSSTSRATVSCSRELLLQYPAELYMGPI